MPARFLTAGDSAITIELGNTAELQLSMRCLDLHTRISNSTPPGVVEIVPALRSVTVHYDPCITSANELRSKLSEIVDSLPLDEINSDKRPKKTARPQRRWLLPACYEPEHGIDLDEVCWATGLHQSAVTELHAAQTYRVLMVGFLPGQPYIGELPPLLRLPRKSSPRVSVAAGSIGIASTMSVIYPQASPGGWHILARTPVPLFDICRSQPALLSPGDELRFRPITSREFDACAAGLAAGEITVEQFEASA